MTTTDQLHPRLACLVVRSNIHYCPSLQSFHIISLCFFSFFYSNSIFETQFFEFNIKYFHLIFYQNENRTFKANRLIVTSLILERSTWIYKIYFNSIQLPKSLRRSDRRLWQLLLQNRHSQCQPRFHGNTSCLHTGWVENIPTF